MVKETAKVALLPLSMPVNPHYKPPLKSTGRAAAPCPSPSQLGQLSWQGHLSWKGKLSMQSPLPPQPPKPPQPPRPPTPRSLVQRW